MAEEIGKAHRKTRANFFAVTKGMGWAHLGSILPESAAGALVRFLGGFRLAIAVNAVQMDSRWCAMHSPETQH